jgi:uncharacterized protein YhbP (UPF0306 family)
MSTPTPNESSGTEGAELLSAVLALLAREHVLTLACHDAQGSWAAPVFFALDGADLVFLSSPLARHSLALQHERRCAGAVHAPAADWEHITGVQLAGDVQELDGSEATRVRAVYEQRFPFVATGGDGLTAALQRSRWYRLRMDEAVLIDNTRGLGRRLRWTCPTDCDAGTGT